MEGLELKEQVSVVNSDYEPVVLPADPSVKVRFNKYCDKGKTEINGKAFRTVGEGDDAVEKEFASICFSDGGDLLRMRIQDKSLLQKLALEELVDVLVNGMKQLM